MPETEPAAAPDRFDFEKLFPAPQGTELPGDAPGDDRTDAAPAPLSRAIMCVDPL
jgi:hypothetical protein